MCKNTQFNAYELVFSTINESPCTSLNSCVTTDEYLEYLQRFDIEEADVKIMIHIHHAVKKGFKNIYLLSSDMDVIILTLFFGISIAYED